MASPAEQQAASGNPDSNPNVNPQLSGQPSVGSFDTQQVQPQVADNGGMRGWESDTMGMPRPVMPNQQANTPQEAQAQATQDRQRLQQVYAGIRHPAIGAFGRFFEGMIGGPRLRPVIGPDGQPTGETQVIHPSKGAIAAGILAGALAGMAANNPRATGDYRKDLSGNLAAGAEAVKQQQYEQRYKELNMSEEQQKYRYQTTKANLDLMRQGYDISNLQQKAMDSSVADGSAIYQSLVEAGVRTNPAMTDITGEKLQELLQNNSLHIVRDSAIITGSRPAVDKDGKPIMIAGTQIQAREPLYTVIDPTSIATVTNDLSDLLPQLKGVTNVPVRVLATLAHDKHNLTASQQTVDDWVRQHNDAFPGHRIDNISVKDLLAQDPTLRQALPYFATMFGHDPDEAFKELEKKGVSAPAIAQALFGNLPNGRQSWVDKRKGDAASEGLIEGPIKDVNNANAILVSKNPLVTEARKDEAQAFIQNQKSLEADKLNQTTLAAEQREAAKQADKDRREMGYVEATDGSGDVYHVSRYEAENNPQYSAQTFEPMKPSDVKKDRDAIKPVNDIQLNINGYRNANNAYAAFASSNQAKVAKDRDNLRTIFSSPEVTAAAGAHAEAGGFGFSIPTVTASLNKTLAEKINTAYNSLSDQAKALADSYIRLRGAIPAYVKVLTNTGRSNKEQLDLELQNIQLPYYNSQDISNRLERFQGNLDVQKQGFPKNLPGGRFAPSSASASVPKVGDIVSVKGQRVRVTAVGANGQIQGVPAQ
jgi:hypothetical protein